MIGTMAAMLKGLFLARIVGAQDAAAVPPPQPARPRPDLRTRFARLLSATRSDPRRAEPWRIAGLDNFHPGAAPADGGQMAADVGIADCYARMCSTWNGESALQWLGFPYLAELAVRPEYRKFGEGYAREITRKWIQFKSKSSEDRADAIKELEDAVDKFRVREHIKWAVETDSYFGRAQLYIDLGNRQDRDEQLLPLAYSLAKIGRGSLQRFSRVEPMWSYPGRYNASDPLAPDFYVPQSWYIQGQEIDRSRLITFLQRPVSDILKPAYAFSGLSMSQMTKPYVDNWLRTRQSVSDLIHSFSVPVLSTNLMAHLADGDDDDSQLVMRIALWNSLRDNRDTLVLDKDQETFQNISTPIGGLDKLQAQSQEQMATISSMPLVVLLGSTPTGLNASSEGELEVWGNVIHAIQEANVRPHLSVMINIIQLSLWGRIDPDIVYDFVPLTEMSEADKASIRKTNADTAMVYIDGGVIAVEEERERLAGDDESLWSNIDAAVLPTPPANDNTGDGAEGGDDGEVSNPSQGASGFGTDEADTAFFTVSATGDLVAADKDFSEADHPRGQPGNAGQFGPGGGGGSTGGQTKAGGETTAPKAAISSPAGRASALSPASQAGAKGVRTQASGAALPAHIAAIKIPPAWSDVRYNPDPDAPLQVSGKDAKGRPVAVYSEKFSAEQAAKKFARVEALAKQMQQVETKNAQAMKSKDPATRDAADCLDLIMKMGLRPGSETDTGAKVQAYGATTLQGQHVKQSKDGVVLQFTGKKGVALSLPVTDPALAKRLAARAKAAGPTGQLFGISETQLLAHTKSVAGPHAKTKDFRTHLGTKIAGEMVKSMPPPTDEKSYKKAVLEVAKVASSRLGNTPAICLQSYLNPAVFAPWQQMAGVAS